MITSYPSQCRNMYRNVSRKRRNGHGNDFDCTIHNYNAQSIPEKDFVLHRTTANRPSKLKQHIDYT